MDSGHRLLTGGDFGIEASVLSVAVYLIFIGIALKQKKKNVKLREILCFYWNLFYKNVIIRSYDCVPVPAVFLRQGSLCIWQKIFYPVCRKITCFGACQDDKRTVSSYFYGQRSIILGILIWLCIHYCRKGFFRFSFEKMIDCKGKQILEKKKHFLEMSVNILLLLMIPFVFFRVLLPAAKDLPYALKDQ